MARKTNFTVEQRHDLRRLGVTCQQVQSLQRALPLIAEDAQPRPTYNDIRHELDRLRERFEGAAQWFESASLLEARKVAYGHVNSAAHRVDRQTAAGVNDDSLDALPKRIDPAALTLLLRAVCDQALSSFPPGTQRQKAPAVPSDAVQRVLNALDAPGDAKSVAAAKVLGVSRSGKFVDVVEIVLAAAGITADADGVIRRHQEAQRKLVPRGKPGGSTT